MNILIIVELYVKKFFFPYFSDYYYAVMKWNKEKKVFIQWMNRHQNNTINVLYNVIDKTSAIVSKLYEAINLTSALVRMKPSNLLQPNCRNHLTHSGHEKSVIMLALLSTLLKFIIIVKTLPAHWF